MTGYDDRLQALMEKLAGKDHVAAALEDLRAQRKNLEKRVWELGAQRRIEQIDVDRLEEKSFKSVILSLLGRHGEALDREKAELAAAILKYDNAQKELNALDELIGEKWAQVNDLERAETEYKNLLREKAQYIDSQGGPAAEEIRILRERIAALEAQARELDEAIREGQTADGLAYDVLSSLDSAENWGTMDLFLNKSLISDLAKYSAMDDARERIGLLQMQMRRFQAELADVAMSAEAELNTDGWLRAVDFFIDDIFSAISALKRVDRAREMIWQARNRILSCLSELKKRRETVGQEIEKVRGQLRRCIIDAKA